MLSDNIINAITPGQRALLYSIMEAAKQENESAYLLAESQGLKTIYNDFHRHTAHEIAHLQQLFFANTFCEEMDYLKEYAAHRENLHSNKPAATIIN